MRMKYCISLIAWVILRTTSCINFIVYNCRAIFFVYMLLRDRHYVSLLAWVLLCNTSPVRVNVYQFFREFYCVSRLACVFTFHSFREKYHVHFPAWLSLCIAHRLSINLYHSFCEYYYISPLASKLMRFTPSLSISSFIACHCLREYYCVALLA